MDQNELEKTKSWFIGRISILGVVVIAIWLLEIVDSFLLFNSLDGYGIRPRDAGALIGILIASFPHGYISHVASNSLPFVILGWFVMLKSRLQFVIVSALAMVVGGVGTWLIGGAGTVHIGLSSVVFGYLGFLLLRGFFERSLRAIVVSILIGLLYGGLIFGVLPGQAGISWEGHLFGFLGGVLSARLLARRTPDESRP